MYSSVIAIIKKWAALCYMGGIVAVWDEMATAEGRNDRKNGSETIKQSGFDQTN